MTVRRFHFEMAIDADDLAALLRGFERAVDSIEGAIDAGFPGKGGGGTGSAADFDLTYDCTVGASDRRDSEVRNEER